MASAFSGKMVFDPVQDTITNDQGEEITLECPEVDDLPPTGFAQAELNCEPPAQDGKNLKVNVDPKSERIQLLEPFESNKQEDFNDLIILVKAKGKCTTDHISPAGPWLKFRGHLDNISQNMYSGAENDFTGEIGKGENILTNETDEFNKVARKYKAKEKNWVVIGDDNYGEGSSREHAAMEPRYLGCKAIIVKSFARIAETNLKKQGILPLWIKNPQDYDKFQKEDRITISEINNLNNSQEVKIIIKHINGSEEEILAKHTLNAEQVKWFKEGSALNKVGKELRGE